MPPMLPMPRRAFVAASAAAFAIPTMRPTSSAAAILRRMDGGLADTYPSHAPELVSSVVGKSHFDYDTVHAMVTTRPELAKAGWDWGFGDWETALGAASHMGRRDIAQLLIGHGARPDLFTYAMLGHVDVVRAVCRANPGIQGAIGPHGISLLQHARSGKEPAEHVVEYLEELGGAGIGQKNLPISAADAKRYQGDYVPSDAPGTVFHIGWHDRRETLTIARDERLFRAILRVDDHAFAPGGAPTVRVTFDVHGDEVRAFSIRDGEIGITAMRTAT